MFYSQDILQKRGGKFGIIWIAATKAVPLTRRDYFQVHVRKTCDDIIQYVCLQAQPLRRGGARPRFSLYLSSQLMYGLVYVFNKHHDYLLKEATELSKSFHPMASAIDIDLRSAPKADLVTLNLHVNEFLACSPEFGMLRGLQLAPPTPEIPEAEYLKFATPRVRETSVSGAGSSGDGGVSDFSSPKSAKSGGRQPFSPVLGLHHQATPEQITMTDEEPQRTEEAMMMGEQDLPPMDIQMLNEEATEDPFHVNVSPIRKREASDSRSVLEESLSNLARVVVMQQDPLAEDLLTEDPDVQLFTDQDSVLPPADITPQLPPDEQDIPLQPHKMPPQPTDDVTVLPSAQKKPHRKRKLSFSLTLDPIEASPLRRPRPKRPVNLKVDPVTQIPREAIKQQIESGDKTTTLPELAGHPVPTMAELFSRPARKGLTKNMWKTWKNNAYTEHNVDADQELEQLCWSVPRLNATSSSSDQSDLELQHIPPDAPTADEISPLQVAPESSPPQRVDDAAMKEQLSLPELGLGTSDRESIAEAQLSRLMGSVEHGRDVSLDASKTGGGLSAHMDSLTRSRLDSSDNESIPRQRETSMREDPAPGEMTLGVLTEVPEEHLEEAMSPLDVQDPTAHAFNRLLQRANRGQCTFRDVFPPRYTTAKDAAAAFTTLLDMAAKRLVKVSQQAPYADIFISAAN